MKSIISAAMKVESGRLHLFLAKEAYDMGTDAPDVRRIIHITPPASTESE